MIAEIIFFSLSLVACVAAVIYKKHCDKKYGRWKREDDHGAP